MTKGAPSGPRALFVVAFDNAVNWSHNVAAELAATGVRCEFVVPKDERFALSDAQRTLIGDYPLSYATSSAIIKQALSDFEVVVLMLPGIQVTALLERMQALYVALDDRSRPFPVTVSGFFGLTLNNVAAGYVYRSGIDVLAINHEADHVTFTSLAANLGLNNRNLVTAGLGMLPAAPEPMREGPIERVLYADQPTVPNSYAKRRYVYERLVRYAIQHPDREVLLKPRHRPEEGTFHKGGAHTESIVRDLGALPKNFSLTYEPISNQVATTDLLITVSSTAAIEALGAGCRVAFVADLGVEGSLMNEQLVYSGLTRTFDQLEADNFGTPEPEWFEQYFPAGRDVSPAAAIVGRVSELLASGERPGLDNHLTDFSRSYAKTRAAVEKLRIAREKHIAAGREARKAAREARGSIPYRAKRFVKRLLRRP